MISSSYFFFNYQQQLSEISLDLNVVKASKDAESQKNIRRLFELSKKVFIEKDIVAIDYSDLAVKCIHAAWISCFSSQSNRINPHKLIEASEKSLMRINSLESRRSIQFFMEYVCTTLDRNEYHFSDSLFHAENSYTFLQSLSNDQNLSANCMMQKILAFLRQNRPEQAEKLAEEVYEKFHECISAEESKDEKNVSSDVLAQIREIILTAEESVIERLERQIMQIKRSLGKHDEAIQFAALVTKSADARISGSEKPDEKWAYSQTACAEVYIDALTNSPCLGDKIDLNFLLKRQLQAYEIYVPDPENITITFNVFRSMLALGRIYHLNHLFYDANALACQAKDLADTLNLPTNHESRASLESLLQDLNSYTDTKASIM